MMLDWAALRRDAARIERASARPSGSHSLRKADNIAPHRRIANSIGNAQNDGSSGASNNHSPRLSLRPRAAFPYDDATEHLARRDPLDR
ncbi:hypothetical protein [Burkholderia sp. 567]|uniref:hypothetical protein n=1 Tax=Burkholderia sp. 567 TaxID=3156413 RepID=UPI0033952C05